MTSAFENPQLSTAIGLIKYAHAMLPERPQGFFSRIGRKFKFFSAAAVALALLVCGSQAQASAPLSPAALHAPHS